MALIKLSKLKNSKALCGDCKHFSKEKKFDDTCKHLGVIATSRAPTCYEPDLYSFRKIFLLPAIEDLGNIIKDYSPKQCRILATLLETQSKIKENQYYFGQPVFLSLGEEYLSHYYKAFVLSFVPETGYVNLVAQLKDCKTATAISVPKETILNQLQFNEKAVELDNAGRIVRDKKELEHFRNLPLSDKISKKGLIDVSKLIRLDLDFDVPTIDNAPKELLAKKKRVKDLTEIFEEVAGVVKTSKLKTKKKEK